MCDFKQSNGGRLVVCTRIITLDCETLNIAKGEDWICTRTITIDACTTLNRAKGGGLV